MQHQEWRSQIEQIAVQLQERSDLAAHQFAQRLLHTLQRDFPPHRDNEEARTLRHHAFTHALQLYDLSSVLRLIATYDLSHKVPQGIVPRIQKSCNSLAVIRSLDDFASNPVELRALGRYRLGLERSLQQVLRCEVDQLHDPQQVQRFLKVAHRLPVEEQQQFFVERLRSLFSRDYQAYLVLKNRYFLSRIRQALTDEAIARWLHRRLDGDGRVDPTQLLEQLRTLDFRTIELLLRELLQQHPGHPLLRGNPVPWKPTSEGGNEEPEADSSADGFELQTYSAPTTNDSEDEPPEEEDLSELSGEWELLPVGQEVAIEFDAGPSAEPAAEPIGKELAVRKVIRTAADHADAFRNLLLRLKPLLKKLNRNLQPIYSTSSPYFRPRNEDYTEAQRLELETWLALDSEAQAALREWIEGVLTSDLESSRWKREEAVEIWESDPDLDEEFLAEVRQRNKDHSLTLSSLLPFPLTLPTPEGPPLALEKGRRFALQLGVAFLDQDQPSRKRFHNPPTPYFKLFFKGQQLQRRGALIHLNQESYFMALPEQVNASLILFHLMLPMLHLYQQSPLPLGLQYYLLNVFDSATTEPSPTADLGST